MHGFAETVDALQVLQRIYKYGGQPVARDFLTAHYGQNFEDAFGKKTGKAILHSTAGRFVVGGQKKKRGVVLGG